MSRVSPRKKVKYALSMQAKDYRRAQRNAQEPGEALAASLLALSVMWRRSIGREN